MNLHFINEYFFYQTHTSKRRPLQDPEIKKKNYKFNLESHLLKIIFRCILDIRMPICIKNKIDILSKSFFFIVESVTFRLDFKEILKKKTYIQICVAYLTYFFKSPKLVDMDFSQHFQDLCSRNKIYMEILNRSFTLLKSSAIIRKNNNNYFHDLSRRRRRSNPHHLKS